MSHSLTASNIINVAQELLQTQGYHAFSYRDLSQRIGIKTSSIHYHFPTKADLVKAVLLSYHKIFLQKLDELNKGTSAKQKLMAYANMFVETFNKGGRICLCASLASDLEGLPKEIRAGVCLFIDTHEAWLTEVIQEGIETGEFRECGDLKQNARNIFHTFEGAMLVARTSSVDRIEDAGRWVLILLTS